MSDYNKLLAKYGSMSNSKSYYAGLSDVVITHDSNGYSSATVTLPISEKTSESKDEKYFYGTRHCTESAARKEMVYDTYRNFFAIKRVIFSGPATIVFWEDGTKTVVKCYDGDIFTPETGIAMCMAKKIYGKDKYHGVFRRAIKNAEVNDGNNK